MAASRALRWRLTGLLAIVIVALLVMVVGLYDEAFVEDGGRSLAQWFTGLGVVGPFSMGGAIGLLPSRAAVTGFSTA